MSETPPGGAAAAPWPLTVLTGFLGSGKTTLLSRAIRDPRMARTAVVINELGEVGLDHLLVARTDEQVVLMESGCLCCTIRTDLSETLNDLRERRQRDAIPAFDRVLIETTGLADPAPILHTLMTDDAITAAYRLDGVVATVDALHGMGQLDRQPESVKQVAVADRLVVTKTDLVSPESAGALRSRLHGLNPAAAIVDASRDSAVATMSFAASQYSLEGRSFDVQRWLREEAYVVDAPAGEDTPRGAFVRAPDGTPRHDGAIRSFCILRDEPLPWGRVVGFLDALTRLRGADLLRVKGLLNVRESEQPIVIQGVQHLFHPAVQLPAWPSADRRSRLVFITRDVPPEKIEEMLRVCLGEASPF